MGGKWILISSFVAAWGKVDPYFCPLLFLPIFLAKVFGAQKCILLSVVMFCFNRWSSKYVDERPDPCRLWFGKFFPDIHVLPHSNFFFTKLIVFLSLAFDVGLKSWNESHQLFSECVLL